MYGHVMNGRWVNVVLGRAKKVFLVADCFDYLRWFSLFNEFRHFVCWFFVLIIYKNIKFLKKEHLI